MINELKYRAWDKARNKMFDVTLINFRDKLVSMIYDSNSDFEETQEIIKDYNVPFSRIELMQCLGVKDKKGKEIWEGDIVNLSFEHFSKTLSIFGVVYWNKENVCFSIYQISKNSYTIEHGDCYSETTILKFYNCNGEQFRWNELEIVGNIYENKELYEEQLKKYKSRNKEEH